MNTFSILSIITIIVIAIAREYVNSLKIKNQNNSIKELTTQNELFETSINAKITHIQKLNKNLEEANNLATNMTRDRNEYKNKFIALEKLVANKTAKETKTEPNLSSTKLNVLKNVLNDSAILGKLENLGFKAVIKKDNKNKMMYIRFLRYNFETKEIDIAISASMTESVRYYTLEEANKLFGLV